MKNVFTALKSKTAKSAAVVTGLIGASAANAQFDPTSVTAQITSANGHIETIGAAVLGAIAIILMFKLVKRVM